MKAAVWKRAVTKYVVPELPGSWLVRSSELVREPAGHLVCAVTRRNSGFGSAYYLHAMVQPLYVPMDAWDETLALRVGQATGDAYWPGFEDLEEGRSSMSRMAELIREEALPYFQRYGRPEGYLELCEEFQHGRDVPNLHVLWRQASTEVLIERYEAGLATLSRIHQLVHVDGDAAPWMLEIATAADELRSRVESQPVATRDSLLGVETQMCAHFKLPAS